MEGAGLTLAVAAENFFNRMNAALGVEEQGFCAMPARTRRIRRRGEVIRILSEPG